MADTIIAIDCDGTLFKHEYPRLGKPVPGAMYWLREFQKAGAKLVLFTMRDHKTLIEGEWVDSTDDPVRECAKYGIKFWGINENPEQKEWTLSPKCWANIYIDDHGVCTPLVHEENKRSYVDWSIVGPEAMTIIEKRRLKGSING